MKKIIRTVGLLMLASLTSIGCDQRRAPAGMSATNPPAMNAPKAEAADTNLVEVSLVGNLTREQTVFFKTSGEERKMVRYILVTADGEKWTLQAVAAREVLAQVVGHTVTVKGLARGRLVKRITQLKPLTPIDKPNDAETTNAPPVNPKA